MPATQVTRHSARRSRALSKPAAKRRTVKAKRPRKTTATEANVLLVAQFADALGEPSARKTRRPRRSLSQALDAAHGGAPLPGLGDLDLMPGVIVAAVDRGDVSNVSDSALAPCIAVHRRHRRRAIGVSVAAWSCAVMVSGAIISVAAAGFLAAVPVKAPATIDMASAAHIE